MSSFHLPIRVYIEDTDAAGIVYYVNYLKYMERARTEFLRALGYARAALFADDLMFVVHSLQCKYLLPAKLDDELIATAAIKKSGKATVLFEQQIWRERQLLCSGEVKIACVDRGLQKPASMPDELLSKIEQKIG